MENQVNQPTKLDSSNSNSIIVNYIPLKQYSGIKTGRILRELGLELSSFNKNLKPNHSRIIVDNTIKRVYLVKSGKGYYFNEIIKPRLAKNITDTANVTDTLESNIAKVTIESCRKALEIGSKKSNNPRIEFEKLFN